MTCIGSGQYLPTLQLLILREVSFIPTEGLADNARLLSSATLRAVDSLKQSKLARAKIQFLADLSRPREVSGSRVVRSWRRCFKNKAYSGVGNWELASYRTRVQGMVRRTSVKSLVFRCSYVSFTVSLVLLLRMRVAGVGKSLLASVLDSPFALEVNH